MMMVVVGLIPATYHWIYKANWIAFDVGRTAIRFAVDAFDEELEDTEGLSKDMRVHFGVETTPEILGVAVRLSTPISLRKS